jgi:hypothetical protein
METLEARIRGVITLLRRRRAPANRATGFFCGLGRHLYFCVAYMRAGIGLNIPPYSREIAVQAEISPV